MTKEELIFKTKELEKIVESQKHLSEAVDAKDREILVLRRDLQDEREKNNELKNQNNSLSFDAKHVNETIEALKRENESIKKENKELVENINTYIHFTETSLTALQSYVEMAVELEMQELGRFKK